MKAVNSVVENRGEFVGAFRENVIRVIGNYAAKNMPTEFDVRIEELQKQMLALIEDNAKRGEVDENFDQEYQKFAGQIRDIKVKKLEAAQEWKQVENYTRRWNMMRIHKQQT